ncbi:HET domain protein [Colletotrichum tofieldiae]|nr:HET domain protein [Colletotrichum tofieldiae]GKT81577.1 HET domain protein [Colletotrichum tofieldiae]
MSANESRRRDGPSFQQKDDSQAVLIPFKYQKLDDEVDSTRFVQIESAESETAPLVCSMAHVPFGERPKFEALSYMWGDANDQKTITLNGGHFDIRRNLFDALVYLRRRQKTGLLWVDAICIDQHNLKERTKQVRNMRHIYFRAESVVVWLGSKYSMYQAGLTEVEILETVNLSAESDKELSKDGDIEERIDTAISIAEREMVRQLVMDEYWNRLWIIQEVGQNESKRVCFGHLEVGWDDFIHFVTMHNGEEGPLRLAQQLSQKYGDAHTLRRLLIDHKDA